MTLLERITSVLERARIDGGWTDEGVAQLVLAEMRLINFREDGPSYSTGDRVRVERTDNEVHLILTADTIAAADDLARDLIERVRSGALRLTLGPS